MPGLDGFEICKVLKSSPFTSGIPVIFVTALDQRRDETRGPRRRRRGPTSPSRSTRRWSRRACTRTSSFKRARDLLEKLASVDPLTGVANRRRFDMALEEEWRRVRAGRPVAVAGDRRRGSLQAVQRSTRAPSPATRGCAVSPTRSRAARGRAGDRRALRRRRVRPDSSRGQNQR